MLFGDTGLGKFTLFNVLCEDARLRKFTLLYSLCCVWDAGLCKFILLVLLDAVLCKFTLLVGGVGCRVV